NALAKQGEYEKAIAAYRQALQRDPKMADARANLDAVEDWLKKHQKPSPQSGQQGNSAKNDQHGNPSSSSGADSSSSDTVKQSEKSGVRQDAASSASQASSATGGNSA